MFGRIQLVFIITTLLGCVSVAFSGEKDRIRDPQEIMGKTWQWISTVTPVETVKVSDPARYTIRLDESGKVQARFDCNRGGGNYTISEGKITFGPMMSTSMACPEDTQDALFMRDLQKASSFFLENGDLYLELALGSGTMRFKNVESNEAKAKDPLDAAYTVEGQIIQLQHGKASRPAAPGSASMVETSVFGTPYYGDLNGDGNKDAVLFLKHNPGGSGTFFYVAASLCDSDGWQGTKAILLGDRIYPQGLEIKNGLITVRFLGRKPEEPMSSTVGTTMIRTLVVKDRQLKEYKKK